MEAKRVTRPQPTMEGLAALREALALIRPRAQEIIGRFYERLLERRPDFAPHFAKTDWENQRRMLLNAVVLAIESEEEPEAVEGTIKGYGHKHVPFNLTAADYDFFGATLRETLVESVGEAWTADVDGAWAHAFAKLVEGMRGTNGRPVL